MWFHTKNKNPDSGAADPQAAAAPPAIIPPAQKHASEIELAQRDLLLAYLEPVHTSQPAPEIQTASSRASIPKSQTPPSAAQPVDRPAPPPAPASKPAPPLPEIPAPVPPAQNSLPPDFHLDHHHLCDDHLPSLGGQDHQFLEKIMLSIVTEDLNSRINQPQT